MNTRVRRKSLGAERSGAPHPNALSVIQHVQQYLAGAQNEEALEAFVLAIGKGLALGWALDEILRSMSELFIGEGNAAALTGALTGKEREAANDSKPRGMK